MNINIEKLGNILDSIETDLDKYYRPDFNIDHIKNLLSENLPRIISNKSEFIIDTLINELIIETGQRLEKASNTLQSEFYERDFRNEIKKMVKFQPQEFKFTTKTRSPIFRKLFSDTARDNLKIDIFNYIQENKQELINRLKDTKTKFNFELISLCNKHGFKVEKL